ncbi:MAG: UPF0182 family protein [Clostridia bacterium]|nr:UPF0182 family protein [Clostridia bacterium]MDD4146123.1 UPF0182 family protein [Clostridia bacterium]
MADIFDYPPKEETPFHKFKGSKASRRKWLAILILVLLFLFIRFFISFKLDWTWFNALGYDVVFWRAFTGKALIGAVIFIAALLLSYLNIFFVFRIAHKPFRPLLALIPAFFVAVLVTGRGSQFWLQILQCLQAEPFGIADPQFNLDIGFYVFKLPVLWLVYRLVNLWLLFNVLIVIPLYLFLLSGRIEISTQYMTKRIFTKEEQKAITHVGFLSGFFFVWQAFQYKLLTYELLFSQEGSVIGAGAAALGAKLPSYNVMMLLSLALGVFIFFVLHKNIKKALLSIVMYFLAAALITGFFPGMYQKFLVDPDELRQELPYLERNITYTRQAYGLENLTTEEYPIGELTSAEINKNREIIDNIRLLDHRATRSTYAQQQEIRLYYDFIDVDVDRYLINGKPTQVLLSARELNKKALEDRAKTFNNMVFKYTHGFGLVMSPANAVSETGLPQYLIKDIPPQSALGPIEQPRIYFGEGIQDNVIAKTGLKEFDYPLGDDNQEYVYEGKKGIPMTFFNKILLALRDLQFRYILSDYITSESQYLETRNIKERVNRIAPFLSYDQDPYLVLGEDRHLYYLLDAYTVTDKYPYSQAVGKDGTFNYMRNSVKIVLNAYSGEVDFYIFDQEDPIIQVYSKIFPTLFKSKADFPQDLQAHLRYPEDYFTVQSLMIRDYHMTNPAVFFTREDRWEFGREVYWGELQTQEPFYSIIKLPGEEKEEFILMRVFSPARKQNMVAWLAARSDGEQYGKLLLYKFPKGVQIPGTAQVESLIDQDPNISSQLTLWGQGGSRVLRGNLLVYPIGGSLLYVEPLYLEAEQNKYPQLKKVFVYYQDTIVMADTLEQALVNIFGDKVAQGALSATGKTTETEGVIVQEDTFQQLLRRLVELYRQGQERIKAGDWAGYGQIQKEIDDLMATLEG